MPGTSRRLPLRIAAGFFAFVFWLPSLALSDLVSGLIPAASDSSAVGDLAYGVIGAVLIAPALASQARRPERKIAPLQQVALVAVALAGGAVATGDPVGLVGAVVVLVPLLVVLALHPGRRDVRRWPRRPSVPLLLIALAAVVPVTVYASKMASSGRADRPPADSFAYVPTLWSAVTAMAFAIVLVSLLAAFRPDGWAVPAACVSVAAFLFGVASIINTDVAASGGRGWGSAAIAWALAYLAVAGHEWRTERE